jgi:hypothetical protein
MLNGFDVEFRNKNLDRTYLVDELSGGQFVLVNGPVNCMLRRAMDLGGFHQVIFIYHTPLVWELMDSILSVGADACVEASGKWLLH